MAVYTHVDQASLDAFLAAYDLGPPLALEGDLRGRRELQLSAGHRARPLHPDALREAGRPGGPALLPRPDEPSGGQGRALPDADPRPRRCRAAAACAAGRRRSSAILPGPRSGGSRRRIARRSARPWRGCIWPARISSAFRPEHASRSPAGAGLFEACRGGADQLLAGLARGDRGRARRARARLARGSAARRDPCRSVSGQRVLRAARR